MVIYNLSRVLWSESVNLWIFVFVLILCIFCYIYDIHKNGVSLYVVPKWFSLVQDTDGWRKGGVLFSVTHTQTTPTQTDVRTTNISRLLKIPSIDIPHKDQMSGHYHSLSMFWCSLCYMCVLYIFSDSISYRWIYRVT